MHVARNAPNSGAKDGEEQEMTNFEELYEKYANDVLRVSYFYLGDRQRAEDVCQDVFVRLMTNAPDLQEGHEKAWLLKVALNRCRDLWRGAWLKRVTLGSPAFELVPAPDDHQRREDEEAMMSAVHARPRIPGNHTALLLSGLRHRRDRQDADLPRRNHLQPPVPRTKEAGGTPERERD